jgi:serine/threonine protein kinase
MFGTQYFAAPEQLIGYLQSDERTDVFGLGATMSYLMTKMPAQQIVAPGKLSSVWEKCIEMDKKARYQSVDELAQDILWKWQN